jgi:predicted O-methyltransferase YrrM
MSTRSTPVSAAHFAYLARHTRGEDDFLRALCAAARAEGIPEISIAPEQASFLAILLRASGARRVIEVGTLAGYSAIAMARALPPRSQGGELATIEVSARHARFAESWIARSDVADRVRVLQGRGADLLPRFPSGWADAAFLDADKAGYPLYLEECRRIVRRGGLILADNAFAFGQLLDERASAAEVQAVRAFNERMASTPGLSGIIVPLGDGLWMAVLEEPRT